MRRILLAVTLALTTSALVLAQTTDKSTKSANAGQASKVEQEIIDLDKKIEAAQKAGDMATLNKLVAPDLLYTVGNPPRVLSREEIERRLVAMKEGSMGMETESDVVIKVYGDTAIKAASFKRIDKTSDGKEVTREGRHTLTYAKVNGQWKLVALHGTPKIQVKQ